MITYNNFFDTSINSSCCGCKVCAAVCSVHAISFPFDEEGFGIQKLMIQLVYIAISVEMYVRM